jgi:Ca2+-binding RTX toxin-like protein
MRLPITIAATCLVTAAPAHAAETFGSDLTLAPDSSAALECGGQGCTWVPSYYRIGNAHPDEAPFDGVVVRFRAKSSAADAVTFRLAVVPDGQITAATTATGPSVTLTGGGAVDTVPARLRAREGTHVAVDTGATANVFAANGPTSGLFGFTPALVDRAPAPSQRPVQRNHELLVNADIERDADRDGYGDETQDPDPKSPTVPDLAPPAELCGDVDYIGTGQDDLIVTSKLRDNAGGLAGNDQINTVGDDDCSDGGPGADMLNGGGGSDVVRGGAGNDRLRGGDQYSKNPSVERDGGDRLFGGDGKDEIIGAGGADVVDGGAGNDDLYGDYQPTGPSPAARDRLFGMAGNDDLTGSRGGDILDGGSGNDDLNGNAGIDRYLGGKGNDSIVAADGRKESIDCGSGSKDSVIADPIDKVKNCEKVQRKR